MTNQFAPIYNQLFCCSCPGGLADGSRCENQTSSGDVLVTFPGEGEAWWLVGLGLLALLLTAMGTGLAAYCCCQRKRHSSGGSEMTTMIRLRNAFCRKSPPAASNGFLNPTFRQNNNSQLAPIDTIVEVEASASEDSLDDVISTRPPDDAQFLQEDADCPDTRPMITDSGGESS